MVWCPPRQARWRAVEWVFWRGGEKGKKKRIEIEKKKKKCKKNSKLKKKKKKKILFLKHN